MSANWLTTNSFWASGAHHHLGLREAGLQVVEVEGGVEGDEADLRALPAWEPVQAVLYGLPKTPPMLQQVPACCSTAWIAWRTVRGTVDGRGHTRSAHVRLQARKIGFMKRSNECRDGWLTWQTMGSAPDEIAVWDTSMTKKKRGGIGGRTCTPLARVRRAGHKLPLAGTTRVECMHGAG